MKTHHVGYLVDDIKKSANEFESLGFSTSGNMTLDSSRECYILFLNNENQSIELIQPINDKSPVYGLRKRHRNSPYHICCETDNLEAEIERLLKCAEYTLIQAPKSATAISGCPKVAFLMNAHIGMIELVEECNKDGSKKN